MSRTIIDIPEKEKTELDKIGKQEGVSRAELVRQGIALLLEQRRRKKAGKIVGPDIRGMVQEGDPRYFKGMSAEDWIREMRGESGDDRDRLYRDWASLTREEWEERMRRYNAGEDI
ncbi:MAG: ribbon-helix-helix protein, CopG family [Alphaproteobacteria bacterium]|nr:ribbon-helix-helix protein, CopG family [Alphaproteobacteria bacterium]